MCSDTVNKALQDFDLALRGKKKRAQFLKDGKKKVLSVWVLYKLLHHHCFLFVYIMQFIHVNLLRLALLNLGIMYLMCIET